MLESIFNRERIYAFARTYAYFFTFFFTLKLTHFVPEKYFIELLAATIVFALWYAHLLKYVEQDSKQFSDVINEFISNEYCQRFPFSDISCRVLLYLVGMIPLLAIISIVVLLFGKPSDLSRTWFNTYMVVLAVVIFLNPIRDKQRERTEGKE